MSPPQASELRASEEKARAELAGKGQEIERLKEHLGRCLRAAAEHAKQEKKQRAAMDEEFAHLRLKLEEQGRTQQRMGEIIAAKDHALAGKDGEIDHLQLVSTEQARELSRKHEELALKDSAIVQLRKEARPGVEVIYVDEGVARIEEEGEGEPAAKRLKVVEENSARRYAEFGAKFNSRLVKVKQVLARGSWCLIAPDLTLSPLK